jgi:hypothetical protein
MSRVLCCAPKDALVEIDLSSMTLAQAGGAPLSLADCQ